jgi:hypothetical protein
MDMVKILDAVSNRSLSLWERAGVRGIETAY